MSWWSESPFELQMWNNKVQPTSNNYIIKANNKHSSSDLNCPAWLGQGIDTGRCWKQIRLHVSPLLDLIDAKEELKYIKWRSPRCRTQLSRISAGAITVPPQHPTLELGFEQLTKLENYFGDRAGKQEHGVSKETRSSWRSTIWKSLGRTKDSRCK